MMAEPLNILDLNDDCLLQIFSYLNAYDLVDVYKINPRFQYVTSALFQRQKNLTICYRTVDLERIHDVITHIGRYLTILTVTVGYLAPENEILMILEPISSNCVNLKRFTLRYARMNEKYLVLLKNISRNLTSLDLSNCDLDDKVEILFSNCEKLEELILMGNYQLQGKSLKVLKNLKLLLIEINQIFDTSVLNYLLKQNPNMKIEFYNQGSTTKGIWR